MAANDTYSSSGAQLVFPIALISIVMSCVLYPPDSYAMMHDLQYGLANHSAIEPMNITLIFHINCMRRTVSYPLTLPLVPFCRWAGSSVGDRLAAAGFGWGRPDALGAFGSALEFCKTLDAFREFCESALDLIGGCCCLRS